MEITAIADTSELIRLVALNLERQLTMEERLCFEEIITLVQGHTFVLELIVHQIAEGRLDIHTALDLIRENGFSRFSGEKVGNNGEEVYDTLSAIISALFKASAVNDTARLTLKMLVLFNVRGLETSLIYKFFPNIKAETITDLSNEGWLYEDIRLRLHPVIAETVRNWSWSADDVTVMNYHEKMINIYVGMSNDVHIKEILREADIFRDQHPRHIITGLYYDMLGWYYDVLIGGAYYPENDEEAELLRNELETMDKAISEMEESSDPRSTLYLTKYYISLASILIRSYPDYLLR